MPRFLDTRGKTKLAVAICARCSIKVAYSDLIEDGNIENFWVCRDGCRDAIDPWRLPARQSDDITLEHPRPDVDINTQAPTPHLYGDPIEFEDVSTLFAIHEIGFARPWQPDTNYRVGDSMTPLDVDDPEVTLPQNWWVCLVAGRSQSRYQMHLFLTADDPLPTFLTADDGYFFLTGDDVVRIPIPPPDWPIEPGVIFGAMFFLTSDDGIALTSDDPNNLIPLVADGRCGDGTVVWLNLGVYPV